MRTYKILCVSSFDHPSLKAKLSIYFETKPTDIWFIGLRLKLIGWSTRLEANEEWNKLKDSETGTHSVSTGQFDQLC